MSATSLTQENTSSSLLAGNDGFATSFQYISSITVGSLGASSVSFTEIPQNFRHLQIRAVTVTTSVSSGAVLQVNSDTGANYKSHYVYGNGASTASGNAGSIYMPDWCGGAATTSPGAAVIDILDYASTIKYKTIRCFDGYDANGSGFIGLTSGLWLSTSAITSLKISLTSFSQFSTFSLYGVK